MEGPLDASKPLGFYLLSTVGRIITLLQLACTVTALSLVTSLKPEQNTLFNIFLLTGNKESSVSPDRWRLFANADGYFLYVQIGTLMALLAVIVRALSLGFISKASAMDQVTNILTMALLPTTGIVDLVMASEMRSLIRAVQLDREDVSWSRRRASRIVDLFHKVCVAAGVISLLNGLLFTTSVVFFRRTNAKQTRDSELARTNTRLTHISDVRPAAAV